MENKQNYIQRFVLRFYYCINASTISTPEVILILDGRQHTQESSAEIKRVSNESFLQNPVTFYFCLRSISSLGLEFLNWTQMQNSNEALVNCLYLCSDYQDQVQSASLNMFTVHLVHDHIMRMPNVYQVASIRENISTNSHMFLFKFLSSQSTPMTFAF